MKPLFAVAALALGGALAAAPELPEELKPFAADFAKAMPQGVKTRQLTPGVYHVLDAKDQIVGKLCCERIADDERQMAYAGTIEIAVLFGPDDKVAGVLIGKNQETVSFLNRVRAAKFLERWNQLKMGEIANHQVDAVTGATYSSAAIRTGVRKLAESYLAGEDNAPAAAPVNREAVAAEIAKLEKSTEMHRNVLERSEKLLTQLETRKSEELELRLIAALDGNEKAAAFAQKNSLIFYNHPRRGDAGETKVEALVKKYRVSGSEADLAELKAAILEEYEGLLMRIVPHNEEHAKAVKAAEARIRVLKQKLNDKPENNN